MDEKNILIDIGTCQAAVNVVGNNNTINMQSTYLKGRFTVYVIYSTHMITDNVCA